MRKILVFIFISFFFSACISHKFEGESSYKRTIVPTSTSTNRIIKLFPKYSKVDEISKNDIISVHLSNGFIFQSPESKSFKEIISNQGASAEIAIVANVCEQGIEGCSAKFGPNAQKEGKVIYFSDSVKAQQMLNLSYLPMYGPITYTGKPLIIQLSVIELDISGTQEQNLVKKLAELGAAYYPPASPVVSTLTALGQTFLQGNQHDVIFRYSLILAPSGGDENYKYPKLSTGDFVFIRKDTTAAKQKENIWNNLLFDSCTGKLYKNLSNTNLDKKDCKTKIDYTKFEEFRDNTYFTIQIQKGFEESSLDTQQTLEIFTQELKNEKNLKFENLDNKLTTLSNDILQQNNSKELFSKFAEAKKVLKTTSTQEKIDKQKIASVIFADSLKVITIVFKKNNCINKTKENEKKCSKIISSNKLQDLIIDVRANLISKNKELTTLDSIIPLALKDLDEIDYMELKLKLSTIKN